ncbi:hypothetical protein CK934_28795 [Chitinophaga sp. MD30]|nr:hypothetical protein CK934_28795 [Chitinophaga sp. MD30]
MLAGNALTACNTGTSRSADTKTGTEMAGQWLAADYLRQVAENHSIAHTSAPVYGWVALSFSPELKDSVLAFNGFEEPDAIPFTREGDSLKLDLPSRVYIHKNLADSNTFMAVEYADGQVFKEQYVKVDAPLETPDATFDRELRKSLFGNRQYHLITQEGKPAAPGALPVVFKEDGIVTGLPGYASYQLCYAGDCIQTTDTSDIIFLTPVNSKEQPVAFLYNMSLDGNKMALYAQEVINANEKGSVRKGKLLYELSTQH